MPRTLLIDCSPNGEASLGGRLAREMAERLQPCSDLQLRDLVAEPLPPLTGDYARALMTRAAKDDPAFAVSETLVREVEAADHLLIATPMHNYMVPACLKLWLDYVVRIQRTFTLRNGTKEGLLEDRPCFVVISSGGTYLGARASQADFLTPYLRHILGVIGLHHVEFFHLQGLAQGPEAVAQAEQQIRARLDTHPYFNPIGVFP